MSHPAFDEFVNTIAALCAPGGCPWDMEQTHRSIASNMIEEAYEAVDAIEADDVVHMREEFGDVLLQVVLQSQIASDEGEFTIDDVCRDVNDKIVRRHPHVFGNVDAGSPEEVLRVWDKEKLAERQAAEAAGLKEGLLDGIPRALPALTQAQKISRKAAAAGFDWDGVEGVWEKVAEEEVELRQAYAAYESMEADSPEYARAKESVTLELGDMLFALVNVARKMGVNAEEALRASCSKFRARWASMEIAAEVGGKRLEDMPQPDQERLWEAAKLEGI